MKNPEKEIEGEINDSVFSEELEALKNRRVEIKKAAEESKKTKSSTKSFAKKANSILKKFN